MLPDKFQGHIRLRRSCFGYEPQVRHSIAVVDGISALRHRDHEDDLLGLDCVLGNRRDARLDGAMADAFKPTKQLVPNCWIGPIGEANQITDFGNP